MASRNTKTALKSILMFSATLVLACLVGGSPTTVYVLAHVRRGTEVDPDTLVRMAMIGGGIAFLILALGLTMTVVYIVTRWSTQPGKSSIDRKT